MSYAQKQTANSFTLTIFALLIWSSFLNAQSFARLTIDQEPFFRRAAWMDYDNDGDLDLFFGISNGADTSNTHSKLFRNDGNDNFVEVTPPAMGSRNVFTIGLAQADYDNDGSMDLFAGNANATLLTSLGSFLYHNLFPGTFEIVTTGDIGAVNTIAASGASWVDYDNDGDVDLFAVTPRNLAYPGDTLSSVLFDNNGDGTFARNTTSVIVNGAFTNHNMPTWSDYDGDGDMDLYIAIGPVDGSRVQDLFYVNLMQETGSPDFVKETAPAFASDTHDGQNAWFVDYDNDNDLDVYIVNWGGSPPTFPPNWPGAQNELYRNDGGGVYTKITTGGIATDSDISTAQVWGDFDNDGDLDAYVTNNTSSRSLGGNRYYQNSGFPDYTFSRLLLGDLTVNRRASLGAAVADYDNDGDLDLYVMLSTLFGQAAVDALYRNDSNNDNSWVNITCVGMQSNKSGIGTKLRAKATIFGNAYWQMREISNHLSFGSTSSLRAHFGFGDATAIDSLIIEWPSGIVDNYTDVAANQLYEAIEGDGLNPIVTQVETLAGNQLPSDFALSANYPNPFNPSTQINYDLPRQAHVILKVYDLLGKEVRTLLDGIQPPGTNSVTWNGRDNNGLLVGSGIYFYEIRTGDFRQARKMTLLR